MARIPLLQMSGIALTFGGDPVFSDLDLVVQPSDRVALVGRNGSGKSTLMKVMAGLVEADTGTIVIPPGRSVGYMEQDPTMAGFATLGDFACSGLEPGELYKVERAGEGLKFDPARSVETASGGERRRAALAKLMAESPDLMLLDEPTNHLDIEAIGWLERELKSTRAAYVLISHDRAFLRALTRATLWIDRGQVRRQEKGFEAFEAWRDTIWEEEDTQRHKLNRLIKAEARWAVEGISARRKRNMGRVRALGELRDERSAQIKRQGTADFALDSSPKSGRKVIEAEAVTKGFGDKQIVADFSIKVQRGDRVAFVGPNGVGKTTLLKMLLGLEAPDAGTIKQGTKLEIAMFDQARDQLNPNLSLWDNLTTDPEMGVSGKADQVMVRGMPKHVVGYLKDFLFDESQARAPVRSLSGGEKARLLLAKLMARQSNLLVLDEPTNDLDIKTIQILEDFLSEFPGCLLIVSHDRAFMDNLADHIFYFKGEGQIKDYNLSYSEIIQIQKQEQGSNSPKAVQAPDAKKEEKSNAYAEKLSYNERREYNKLEKEIAKLEAKKTDLTEKMNEASADAETLMNASKEIGTVIEEIDEKEFRWLELSERA